MKGIFRKVAGWIVPRPHEGLPVRVYSTCRDSLEDGDIILCSGRAIASFGIRIFGRSGMSHGGLVQRAGDRVLLIHSTKGSTIKDVFTGTSRIDGVQTVSLSEFVERYNGRVFLRRVHGQRGEDFSATLEGLRRKHTGKRYEKDWKQFFSSLWKGMRSKPGEAWVFCTELMAMILGYDYAGDGLNVIEMVYQDGTDRAPDKFTPRTFSYYQSRYPIVVSPGWAVEAEVELLSEEKARKRGIL